MAYRTEMGLRLVIEPEAFMRPLIFQIVDANFAVTQTPGLIIQPIGLKLRPLALYFWAWRGGNGRASNERYLVIALPGAGSDLLAHKPTAHAFAMHGGVRRHC